MTVDVSVIASGHDVGDARVHRICAALRRTGLTVEVLGLGRAEQGPSGCTVTARPRPGNPGRAWLALRYAVQARGRVLLAVDPDGLVMARLLGGARRRPVVADVHEDYERLLRDRRWARGAAGWIARRLVWVATRSAAGADLTVVADQQVPPHQAQRRLVIPNLPDPAMLPQIGTVRRFERPTAVYVGDLRRSRGLRSMIEAVERAPGWDLLLIGPVAGEDEPWLSALLDAPQLSGRVRWVGRQAPEVAWAQAARGWVGLALLADTPAFREAIPSKIYEYLACGLPLLASDLPRQADLVRESGAGVIVPSGEAASAAHGAAQLRAWLEHPERLKEVTAAAERAGERFRAAPPYDTLAAHIAGLIGP